MPDLTSMFGPGFFFAGAGDSNTPQALRQKIALAMLMQKRKAPSNLGEGLSAIGDSLGDIGMMRRIEGEAAAGEQAGIGAENRILGGGGPQAAAPGSPPPVQAAAISGPSPLYQPDADPRDPTPVPGNVQEGGPPRGMVLRPGIQTPASPQRAALPATPLPPDQQQSDAPGAPIRMPTAAANADWRAQNPLPQNIPPPPAGPPGAPPVAPGGLSVANYGQKPVLALTTPPVMAQGETPSFDAPISQYDQQSDPRREATVALLRQRMGGQGAPAPTAPPTAPPADQGIRPAPPPAPAPAPAPAPPPAQPAQDLPDPGYITPLPPPRRPPPLTTPKMQDIEQEIRAASPSVRESVQARLMPLYEKEKGALAQAHEDYKSGVAQDRELEKLHHTQKAAARAAVDAAREAGQRIAKGNIPEVKQDIDTGLTFNAATGQWEQPKIAGAGSDNRPTFKGNEFQGKALVNYGRARIAQEGLRSKVGDGTETAEELLANSPMQSALSNVPYGVTRSWRSDAFKEADTHADNFVQAFIRQQSGGAYGPAELEQEARGMLPKYGDTAEQIKNKREQREQFLSGLYGIIGPSGQKGVEFDAAKREADRQTKPETKNKVLDFDNEAEVAKARLKPGTRIRVNGRPATVE
jgi:hypothetical protein